MHFDLTEEQKMLQDSVNGFLADQNDDAALTRYIDSDTPDIDLWDAISELGLPAILVPEEHGGLGMDLLTAAVVMESMGFNGTPSNFAYHCLAALAIASGGSDEQKTRWLPGIASGEIRATFACAEALGDGNWQPNQWTLTGDTLTGVKTHVIEANKAQLILVGLAGGKLGIVTVDDSVTIEQTPSLDRTRRLCQVTFNATQVELLAEAKGERIRDAALILHSADAFGAAKKALDMAVHYAGEREQFGRLIGSFQAMKHQLANAAEMIAPTRSLFWYAAHAFDAMPDESEQQAALAKAHITEIAVKVGRAAVEAHGGIGYTWEYTLHVWLKRAMFDRNYMGSPGFHRQRVADLNGW